MTSGHPVEQAGVSPHSNENSIAFAMPGAKRKITKSIRNIKTPFSRQSLAKE